MNALERFGIEPAEEPQNPDKLLSDLCATFNRHAVLPEGADIALALWTIHSYLIEPISEDQALKYSPILLVNSPDRECGKTTVMSVLELLCPRSEVSMNLSDAVLYHLMEARQPTLLIDEADTFINARESLIGILNSGHSPQGRVSRMGGKNYEELVSYSTWGAKAIFGIGTLPDTLYSRCIHIPMKRKRPEEVITRLGQFLRANQGHFQQLSRRILRFAIDNRERIKDAHYEPLDALSDRQQDNWDPLLSIATCCNTDWLSLAKKSALALSPNTPQRQNLAMMLLEDIHSLFETTSDRRLSSAEILHHLRLDETRPWIEYRCARPITARQVAELLEPFEIRPRNFRVKNDVFKGYALDDFEDCFVRYLGKSATPLQTKEVTADF